MTENGENLLLQQTQPTKINRRKDDNEINNTYWDELEDLKET
jgi:hypothetical protein